MKKDKITVCITKGKAGHKTQVIDQKDFNVPDKLNAYAICNNCTHDCENCIIWLLQMEGYHEE